MTDQTTGTDVRRTVSEVCAQLGIGRTKFYELINTGQLEAVDLNAVDGRPGRPGQPGPRRSLRVTQSEIDRFLAARKISASA